MNLSLVLLLAQLANAVVQSTPQIGSTIKQIITDIAGSLSAVIASGVTANVEPATVLAALAGVLSVLQSDPNVPQDKLAIIASVQRAVAAGIAADKEAQQGVDTSKLTPIAPLP